MAANARGHRHRRKRSSVDRDGRGPAQCGSQPGARGGEGGVEFQFQRGFAQGRDGADAANAVDGAELKVKNPFDPDQNVDAGVRHSEATIGKL